MDALRVRVDRLRSASGHRLELFREAVVMVLYVSVVEIAELAALPESQSSDGTSRLAACFYGITARARGVGEVQALDTLDEPA